MGAHSGEDRPYCRVKLPRMTNSQPAAAGPAPRGSDLNAAQEFEEQRQLLAGEEVGEAGFVVEHIPSQDRQLLASGGGEEQILAPSVGGRLTALDPAFAQEAADEADDRGLVDGQLIGELDLGDARVLVHEEHQAEDAGPHDTVGYGAVVVTPECHVGTSDVVAQEVGQYPHAERPRWGGALGA